MKQELGDEIFSGDSRSMHARFTSFAVILLTLCLIFGTSGKALAQVPHSSHVILVMDENTSYATTVANMPWLVSTGNAYGHSTNFISDTTGSLMAYLWVSSGSCEAKANCVLPPGTNDFGCGGAGCLAPITDDNIFREMNNHGISWKVYAQSYAAAGGTVTTPDNAKATHYYRRHNAATWYSDILSNVSGSQARIVDFAQFAVDLANDTLPQFVIIAPDGLHDGHDGGPVAADAFLQANIPALLAKPYFKAGGDGMLIITFDNGDADAAGAVYTAVVGPNVIPGSVSSKLYRHENTFRTILEALALPTTLGAAATAAPMSDFFSTATTTPVGAVTITSPAANAVTGSSVLVTASATEPSAQIYQLQIWDTTTGRKVTQSNPGTSTFSGTVTLAPGTHRLVVEDIATGNFLPIHQSSVTVTVLSDGISISSPLPNASVGLQVPVVATASESAAGVYQLQVWDTTTGAKLGMSLPGTSSIHQTFSLTPGIHNLVIEDISVGTFSVLHTSAVTVTVLADGIYFTNPPGAAITGGLVTVNATARESFATVYNVQVWDATTGVKLGQSAANTSSIDKTFTLAPGVHKIVVEDISAGTFQILHQATMTVTVQ
jgi:phosphatidylinositol-3-phosphatase